LRNIVAGNTVQWTATFYDINGLATNPSNASINIVYSSTSSTAASTAVSMVQSSNTWTATWQSSNAIAGLVSWHLASMSPTINSAKDGQFMLTANPANSA